MCECQSERREGLESLFWVLQETNEGCLRKSCIWQVAQGKVSVIHYPCLIVSCLSVCLSISILDIENVGMNACMMSLSLPGLLACYLFLQ